VRIKYPLYYVYYHGEIYWILHHVLK